MLHENEDYWIPLADVMTGMMLIFMLALAGFMIKVNSAQQKVIAKASSAIQAQAVDDQFKAAKNRLGLVIESDFSKSAIKWSASIDPKNLVIGFDDSQLLFATGKSQPSDKFKLILDEFFPRLLAIVQNPAYSKYIQGISIEGFSSSAWKGSNGEEAYLKNMKLSEERSFNVFNYLLNSHSLLNQRNYLMNNVSVTGNSSAHPVRLDNGAENANSSQRVEFRIILNPPVNN